jgi:sugar phosphate isomerase/epimerase
MFTAERDLCHPDAGERRKAVDYVRAVADLAAAAGAATIIVAPSAVMKTAPIASRAMTGSVLLVDGGASLFRFAE